MRMPFKYPIMSTVERELSLDAGNKRRGERRARHSELVYGRSRMRRKSESKNASNWNGFAAFRNHFGYYAIGGSTIWKPLAASWEVRCGGKRAVPLEENRSEEGEAESRPSAKADAWPFGAPEEYSPFPLIL